jgi:hypothetical protein
MLTTAQELTLAAELHKPAYTEALAARAYATLAATLNAPVTVANPTKEPTVALAPITLKAMLSYTKLPGFVDDLRNAIDTQDREYLGKLLAIAVAGGAITAETAAKLAPLLSATTSTAAPATVDTPGIGATLGLPTLSAEDVQITAHRHFGQ